MNILFALLACAAVAMYFFKDYGFDPDEVRVFRYFTTDSNLLAAAASVVLAVYEIRGGKTKAAVVFKYVGAAAVTITFLTVLCFLGPISGFHGVYSDEAFWLHMVCPLGFVVSFLFLDMRGMRLGVKDAVWALIPVAVYGAVYFIMTIAFGEDNGGWPDFYVFNAGGMWPVTLLIFIIASTAVALLLRLAGNALSGCRTKKEH